MFYGYGILNNHVPTLKATVMGGGVDADALSFITAASITDATQKSAVNTLVKDLKTASIWTKMKAIYPFVGGTATTHKFNLKDPRDLNSAYRLQFVNGWTHSANGALPSGVDGYADTFLTPNVALNSTNSHLSYYSRTDSVNGRMLGVQDDSVGTATHYIGANKTLDTYSVSCTDANRVAVSATNTSAMYLVSRTSLTSLKGYKQGVSQGTNTVTSLGNRGGINVLIGALHFKNPAGAVTRLYGDKQCAFASIGDGLTDTESTALYNAVQAFNTTLSRNI